MPTPEQLRYTKESTGESTNHARTVAESTQTDLDQLSADIKNVIPVKTDLNMTEHVIKAGESITKVLKKKLTGKIKYKNKRLLLLSYAHMFKQADAEGQNINLVNVGDKLSATNGELTITRLDGSSFKVDIYPWENASIPTPEPTIAPKPETEPEATAPVPEVEPTKPEPTDIKEESATTPEPEAGKTEPDPEPTTSEPTEATEKITESEQTPHNTIEEGMKNYFISETTESWSEMGKWKMDTSPEHTTDNNPFYRDESSIKFEKDSWLADPTITTILKSNPANTDKITEIISAMNKKWQTLQD